MGLLFAISPPVVLGALGGASDWIPIMALSLPTPWAVLFLLAKPQVGLFTATYLAWKSKKVENLIPLTGLTVLSLLLYGPSPSVSYATNGSWNLARLWPWSAILSVPLVLYGLREQGFLPAATLFLSPYFQLSSLWTLILPIVKKGDKNE